MPKMEYQNSFAAIPDDEQKSRLMPDAAALQTSGGEHEKATEIIGATPPEDVLDTIVKILNSLDEWQEASKGGADGSAGS